MGSSGIPGVAVAVVEGDRIVYARGFGDDGRGAPITAQTPFWIGSNTKSFTALATMQLVEAGRSSSTRRCSAICPTSAPPTPTPPPGSRCATSSTRPAASPARTGQAGPGGARAVAGGGAAELRRPPSGAQRPGLRSSTRTSTSSCRACSSRPSPASPGRYIREHVFTPLGMGNSYPAPTRRGRTGSRPCTATGSASGQGLWADVQTRASRPRAISSPPSRTCRTTSPCG